MGSELNAAKDLLVKPGDTIVETIEHYKMSQVELARRMGKKPSKVNDLISGKEPITINTALKLEKVLGIDAQFWINAEASYREKLSRIEQQQMLDDCVDWVRQQPYKQLKDCGYLTADKPGPQMAEEALQFYGVASPVQWEACYVKQFSTAAYRKSEAHLQTLGGMAAWLRIGELEMQKLKVSKFSISSFKKVLKKVKSLVVKQPDDFAKSLQSQCADAGVSVIYTPCLPKAPVCGATRWISGTPLIQMTDRFKTNDHFWFTFYHEAGHVLLHGKKSVFIEDFDGYAPDKVKEQEANDFAAKTLFPQEVLSQLSGHLTEQSLRNLAKHYDTHPGVLVGQLQHHGKIPFSRFNNLKESINLFG